MGDDDAMDSTDRPGSSSLEPVTLRVITEENRSAVERLRVAPGQETFVDGVPESLAEAAARPHANPWYRAVYHGDEPVGFVMLADDVPPDNSDIPWRYYLWRLLIDGHHQSRGYGRAALDRLVAYLRTRPGADVLMTSIVAGDDSPEGFYLRYGFQPTGRMFDHERVLELPLRRPGPPPR
jgi:diamine N-acetyltransferase